MPTRRPAQTAVHKISTTPDDPSRGVVAGPDGALRQVRHPARDDRRGVPRHDHRHQRHARARRRRDRHDHDRRLSRHPAHRPPPAAAALLDHAGHPLAGPAAGQAPPSQDGDGAARAAARRGAGAARRGGRAARRCASSRRPASRRSPSASCSPTSTRRTRRARGDRARGVSRRASPPTSSSVSPQFREFERFTTTAMNAFVGPKVRNYVTRLEIGDRGRGLQGRPAHHGVQRRRRDAGHGGRAAGAHPALGPGGRRARRRLGGRPVGPAQPHHLRRRRHLGRYRHRHRRRLRRGHGARHLDRRLPGAGADDRRAHDRRRRRLDRLRRPGRRLPGRAALGRRRARARPPTAAAATRADGHRRQRRARPARPRALPGRRHAARRGGGAPRDRRAGARARPGRPRGGRGRGHA